MSKFVKEKYALINEQLPLLINLGHTINEIALKLGISKSAVCRRCKVLNLSVPNYHNSLKFDNTVFDCIDTEEKAYWLGFLYADGCINNKNNGVSISLKGSDIEHLEKFKQFLKTTKNIYKSLIKLNNKYYSVCRFDICDKHFHETLINLGCLPKKSLILKFPSLSWFKEPNLIYDFIRGYVDGDGCLSFSKNGRLLFNVVGTKDFLEGICNIFPNKFKSIRKTNKRTSNVYVISNCGENADEVTYKLYSNCKIYLDRKYERFAVLNRKV